MSTLNEIIESLRQHAYECDDLDFVVHDSPIQASKHIKCECGRDWHVTLFDIMSSKNGRQEWEDLMTAIQGCNTPTFKQARDEWRRKRKEEQERAKFLQKRKSAIGSLEL